MILLLEGRGFEEFDLRYRQGLDFLSRQQEVQTIDFHSIFFLIDEKLV